jgi:hypothetical protein
MGYGIGERFEPLLAVRDFFAEQVLVVAVERFAIQVLVTGISNRYRGARQNFLDPLAQALLLALGCMQCSFDRIHDAFDALVVGFLIPLRRADLESVTSQMISGKIARARS